MRNPTKLYSPRLAAWLPLASVLVGIASLFYLALTSELTTTGYSIQELQVEEGNWKLRNEQLALELARAKSLAMVEAEATNRLLLTRPKGIVYLQARSTDAIRRASPASRGQARSVPALEKTVAYSGTDPLDPVRNSISSLLAPRSQPSRRP